LLFGLGRFVQAIVLAIAVAAVVWQKRCQPRIAGDLAGFV